MSTVVPKISVLMCVYNEPLEWIMSSIDSILTQTFNNIEFVIINDYPEREELNDLLLKIGRIDNRVKIISNNENLGLTKSLNIGLDECKGKYIARMDADDWAYPNRLQIQYDYMEANPDIIASSALAYEWNGKDSLKKIYRPIDQSSIRTYTFTSSPFIHPLLILRAEILQRYHIKYDEKFRRSQDYKLAVDLLKVGQISNCNEYLLKYRVSPQQITSRFGNEQVQLCKLIRRNYVNNYYSIYGIDRLDSKITINTIKDNRNIESKLIKSGRIPDGEINEFRASMRAIRRIMYYSLSKYSLKSIFDFLLSNDYYHYPYNFRRFIVIILKHFKSEFIPKLL